MDGNLLTLKENWKQHNLFLLNYVKMLRFRRKFMFWMSKEMTRHRDFKITFNPEPVCKVNFQRSKSSCIEVHGSLMAADQYISWLLRNTSFAKCIKKVCITIDQKLLELGRWIVVSSSHRWKKIFRWPQLSSTFSRTLFVRNHKLSSEDIKTSFHSWSREQFFYKKTTGISLF